MAFALPSQDVRALLRLLAELRDLGADPRAWRTHLTHNLERLCAAHVSVVTELHVNAPPPSGVTTNCTEAVTPLQMIDHGIDPSARSRFYNDLYFIDHTKDDALGGIVPLYGSSFTVTRGQVIDDRSWERSFSANDRFRANGCDDFVMSMQPVSRLGVISSLEIYRPSGQRFGDRERLLVELLHEELARDWSQIDRADNVRLTARQREVLQHLVEGASEKEIGYALQLSSHTIHDHVKAIHRAYGARSRGELLASVAKRAKERGARVRLVAEGAAHA